MNWDTTEDFEPVTVENINVMYNQGYYKALLDIRNEIEILTNGFTELKSKKICKVNSEYDEVIN